MTALAERSLHALAILLVLALAVAVLKAWQKRKARRGHALLALPSGKAAVVYFHSASCGVCRASQKPILERLYGQLGTDNLELVAVDVVAQGDVARGWGVTTVPSTYVLSSSGKVAYVNNGLASEATLRRQLSSLEAPVCSATGA